MKKFMIFLLMAFLYLGTCQARSEASHPNNAKLKLLSWVSPTPSQSFLTPSATPSGVDAGVVVTSVAISGAESGCPDQDITLTAVVDGPVTTSGASGLNFLWKIDGEAAPGTNNGQTYEFEPQNITKLSDGQIHEFTVEVSGEGCALSVSPVHPFQMLKVKSIVTGPAVACENDNLTMTASLDPANSSLPLPTVTAWKWFQGGSSTPYATTSENTITLPQTVIGSYLWHAEPIFESGHGCTNSFEPWDASTVIITKFTGALTLALDAANPSPVCEGSNVKLNVTNSLTPSTGFTPGDVTYEWYMDENLVATTTATSYTTTLAPGFHNFYVKAIYANYDCSELKSAPVTVEVKTAPALTIVGDNVICAGQTTNTITATTGFASYSWTKPDGTTASSNTLNANMPGHYTLTATATAANGGCTATADFTVYQFGGDLQVSATEYNVCPGEVVALNANLQGWTNENITYSWSGPGLTGTVNGSTVTVTIPTGVTGAQTYHVTATAADGCSIEYDVVVNVIDPTNATFTVNLDNTQICVGGQVKATANLGSYTGLVDWYVNGILVPGEHASVITMNPTEAGTFTFAATPANTTCTPAVPSTTATAANTVTVYPKPVVTITGDHVICQGATATLTRVIESYEASTAGGYILPYASYQWYGPEAWTGDDDSWSTTTDVPGVFTLEVTWQGAGLETCAASAQFVVTQLGGDLQVYASEQNVCPGTPVMLNANLDGFGNEMISYEWDYNSETTSTITVAPSTTTTYHVTATAADMEMTGTCEMESYITVNVINETAVTPTVTLQTAQNICEGGIATVKATATDVNYYTWYLNGIEVPGQNLPTISMNLFAPGTYTFAAKPVYTCLNPAPTPADKVVTVYAVPEVTVTGNNVICQGASTTLTANITLGSGNYTVNWTGPKTGTGTTLTTNLPGVYTATVTDNTSGCIATADFTVYTVGADLQLTADKMEICKGDMVVLNANLDGFNNENVSYAWTGEGLGSIATGSTVTATPTSAGVKKYVVTATAGGCTMKDSLNINVIDVVVVTSTVANVAALCQGEQLTLTATPNPTGVATEFIWYMNGVEIPGENQLSITMNMDEAGTYTFAAKANVEGCNTATASEPVSVTVYPTPVVVITGEHYYTTDANNPAVLSATAGFASYAWSNGETTQEINVTEYGVYNVTVTDAHGCTAVSEPFTVSSVVDLQAHIEGISAACQHDNVTLSAIVDNDLEGHTYQWMVNNQYISDGHGITGATTAHLLFNVDSLYQYYGQVLANEFKVEIGRTGCATVTTPVHPFLINPVPYVYVAAPEKVCKGNDLTLEAVVYQLGENAQYQYIWFKNGTAFDTIDYVNTITIDGATLVDGDEFAVQVLYQDLACNSDTSDYVKVPFYVEPSPISLNIDPTTICTTNQASVWITDPNTDPENFGAVTYTWYVNGFAMPLAQSDTLVIDFDHNGAYTFWATASYANYPCALAYTDTLTENVVMHPTVAITGDPIICHENDIHLYAVINDTVGTMDYSYDWRLYNYSLGWGTDVITSGSSYTNASIAINNGNVTFESLDDGDPWLEVEDVNAQDYPYVFTVVVTTPEGCQVESAPYFVYVNDTIHVVTTVDYDSVCAEGMITAVAHLGNWNADNLTAQWQVRTYDESTDTWSAWQNIPYGTSGILQHVPGVTSEYRIHVVQTTSGCEAYSEPMLVKVFQPINIHHIVAINHDDNYPTDNVCEGAQLDVTAYILKLDASGNPIRLQAADGTDSVDANGNIVYETYIDSTLTYMWELNGMQLQTIHGPSFSAQAYIYDSDPVDYTYTAYIVYDIPGCELIPVASNTIHVKRNPIVTIEGNHNYCYFGPSYDNVILTAWVDGDLDPDATYKWYKNGEYRSNTNGYDNHYLETWEPSYDNPYIFTVEVTNGDGCTTISDPFEVNVYARPYTNITADADSICEGGYVTMRANLDNYNDPMLTYQWYKNEVNNTHILPGATHEIETFQPVLGTTDYIVKVTHLMDFNTQYCVAYDTFKILVNPIPVVTAVNDLNGEQSICEGRTVTMQATTTGGVTGGEYYTWYRNGEEILDIHSNVFVDAPTAVDNEPAQYVYSVKVRQSASGCESEVYFIDTITVNPNPSLELVTDPIVCAEGDSNVVLYANVDPMPATPVTYKWMEDNAVVATTTDSVYYFTKPYRDYPYSFAVELVNEYGCVAHADATVYVNAAPVVNITATETNICNGGEITVTATLNDWNADQLTYQWYDGTTMIPGATELSYTVVPTEGIHKYNIQIDQLTSLCHATSDTIVVTVNADPTVVINYAADQYTVCDGYQVDLTTTVTGGVAGGEVYTWYRNGQVIEGATAATYSEVVSALNGEPTTYNYAVSVAQTAAGCESNVYDQLATITVNPNPVVMLVTDPIVCDTTGNNITLTANLDPANVGSAVTYKWMEDNAIMDPATYTVVSTNQITLHKGYRDYPYHFAVEVVNDYACSSTSEAEVSVNANPIVNTTVTENNICVGGEITMALNLNDWNADQLTFQWYDNGNIIPGATSLSYTVVPTEGNHEYFVKVFQLTSECEATSIPFTVVVNPIPVIESVVVSQYNVCYGAQLNITATPTDGYKDGEIYTWYRNGVLIPGAVTHTIQDTPGTVDNNIQHYTYTAVVTRPQAGCTSDMLAPAATSAQVTVYPNPVVVITGDQHVCETDSVFLIANVDTTAFPVGSLHYTWYESGQIRDNMAYNLGDNSFYAEYFYARTEPYIFTVNVERNDIEAGCASMSAEYYVYVYPQPVVNITATETQICTDGQVTLTANLNDYNADNIIYQWYEIRYHDVTTTTSYDTTDNYEYETHTEPYIYNIPGATSATYTTNLAETTTLGVMVRQTNSECWANDEIEIIVNPIPVVTSVTVNGVAVDTVCDGAQVTVTATINANGTPGDAVYTWYRNGILIPEATEAIFSENVYTTDNHVTYNYYSVVVTLPASGCVSEMSTMAGVVRINPAPSTVTISGINVLCENDSTTLTAYSDVEGEWTWSTGSHEQSITVPAGVYTVTMKTVEGCEMTSEPFTVEAFGTDLLVSASATSICRGEHTTLYVNQDGWQGNVTYLWDAQAGNSTATTVDVQPDSTTTYHVTATVSSTNGSCNAEGEVTIIVHQLPAAFEVTPSTTLICEGNQITFTAPVDPEVTGYIWYQNGVEIPGENQNEITINFNEAGQYTFAAKAISIEGCISAEASEPVTVTVTPAPSQVTITGINVLCENTTTTLTAQSDVPGIFVWSTGDTATSVNVPAGSYNVTIITAEGCQLTSENFNVEAFGTDLLVSASATSICRGEHTTLYVDQAGWQGNVTYQWDAQAGNSTASTVDVQPDSTTTYHVTATVSSTNGSCTAEGEVTIIVHQLPAQLVVNPTTPTTICQGDQVSFHAIGDATTTAYIWYQNGVEIPGENQADLTVNYNEYGTYSISAKAISNEGCVSALASEPVVVTVKPAPTTVTITGNNVLCMTDSTILTAHSDVPGTFTWNDGTEGATLTVAAGVYNVTLTTAEGCHLTSDNFTVESFGTDILVSASATSICQGEHTTLYVDQDGWQGNVTYAWDAQAGNSTASTVDVQPAQTTTYHVTATVNAESGSCTAEGEVTIIVHPLPAQLAVNATTPTTICQGDQVSFHATGDATTTAYIWYQNGVEIPGENQADLTVNYNEYGTYSISAKAISNEGCVSALASEPVVVTVKPAPTTVTITGNNVLCMTDSTILTAHSDVPGTFTWNDGTEGATLTVAAGVYNVTLTTAEGCHLTSDNFTVESFGTDVLVSASATAICQGEHTTLYVNQDGWQGNVTYQWDAQAGNSTATTVDVQPAATTTYHVTATVNAESGSCTAVGEVTIIVNPLPVVAAVTATDTVVCEGTQVTFTATGDANTTAYIWYNNGVEIPGENQASLTVNFNEQGVYNYAVKAISNEGCVSAIAINAPVVTVNAAPESVVISGNTVICNGGFTTLYANVVPNLPATYEWFKDNVSINANTESIVVTTAGSYKVVASFNGCSTESDAVVVTVEQAPQLQLTAEETTFCAGGSTVITAEATGWNNADVNYNWSNGFQGSAYTFNPAYSGTYTFVVTASQATSGCVAVDSITINVNELPAIPQVTVDNAVVCDGGQITLTVTNPNNNAVYTWYRNGVVIAGANGPILTESPVTVDGDATNYVYNVTATLPMSGCTSIISSNTVVTVIPTPVVTVSVEGNTTLCAGGSTILHANVTPANANYNYQWYKDNVLIEGATTADYVAAEAARETAYMYHVVVTANAGCNVTAYAPAITFVADPVVEATISNNISCVGGTATLTPIVDGGVANVNGLNGYTFEWFRNNPNSTDPNNPYSTTEFVGNTPIYTTSGNEPAGNYTYWVTVTSNYGCQSTSAPVTYSVVADPVVTIVVAQGYPTTVCNGGASMLKANVSGGYGTPSYQWYKNGNLLVGETNQTLNLATLAYGVNDTYTVEVTQTGVGCSNSASAALNTLVTVNPTYTVNITGFGNVCEGGTLTLNATVNGVISGDVLSYQWYKISNGGEPVAISGANAAQYSTTDLLLGNSYDYYVVVTSNISGCSVVSNSVPANVVPAPTVAIQGASTVCEGGDLTLNAFVSGGVDGAAYTYTWTWTGAANGTATTAVPTFVPTVPANDPATPYYFTVTISRNDNTGCTATSEAHEVNVLAIPTVSVTADNSYICQNGQVTFTAHVSPVGVYNYVWTINGQQQAVNAATVTTTMATTGTITASVVVSAANASASCSASATIANPVNVVAVPTVTLAANHTTMCVGGVTTLTATVNANNNIPGNFNYEWIVDGTPVAGVTNTLNQTLTAAGIHHYQVRVFQNNELGCASTWSNEATVQVAEQPVVNLTSEDGLAICEGGSITLTGIVTNYGNNVNGVVNSSIYGNMTFDWTSNGVNVHHNANINNAQNQVTETLNNVGNYTYQVTVTPTGYNCQPQISNEYTVQVNNDPTWVDVHVYSNNGTDACLGEMVYLFANIEGGVFDGGNITGGNIQWVVTDGNGNTANVGGGLGGNSYDIPTVAGTYIYTPTYVGNIGNGCQLTNTNDVQVAVTVHDLPTAAFVSGDSVELCANDPSASAELVINFTGVAPFTYQVVDGNGNIVAQATTMANTVSIYVAPSEQTTYFITMVQDAYCENTALESSAIATVFVNEIDFPETFFVSGCDDNGQVTVTFNVVSGDPNAAFTVVFENGMTASGNIVNNTATFPVPSAPGDYDAVITIDGCSYNIVVRVLVGEYGFGGTLPIMDQRWNDVVVVNNNPAYNGGHTFVGFQWYHNGELIPGATYSNYQEKGGLNGFYSVELIEQDADGNMVTYMTCEMYFNSTSSVKVYPVPANVRQEITIELDLTAEELDGAVLDIYSVTGALINHVENLQPITKIEGFKAQGTYFGRILTGTNEIKTVKFVIVK